MAVGCGFVAMGEVGLAWLKRCFLGVQDGSRWKLGIVEELGMRQAKEATTFGERLRQKRLDKKITLRKFADLIGVSSTYLSQVEQGRYDPPTADRVTQIAKTLARMQTSGSGLRIACRMMWTRSLRSTRRICRN